MADGRGKNPNSRKNLKPPFEKGEVHNPEGGRAHDPVMKEIKKLTNEGLKEVIQIAVGGTLADLRAVVENPNSTVLQVGVAKCLFDAAFKGDWGTFNAIIERITGRVPIVVDNTSSDGSMNLNVTFVKPDGSTKPPAS